MRGPPPPRAAAEACVVAARPPSPTVETSLSGPLRQERLHGVLQVLGLEERAGDVGGDAIGLLHPALTEGPDDLLCRPVGLGGAVGELARELHAFLEQLVITDDAVDH